LPTGAVRLRADPTRLHQVLVNLLTNAARYTEEGGHVWVTAEAAGARVVRVRDDGAGIDPDLLPRIFDLFHQGPSSRARGGLGVGLALVKRLVELHGGSVSAYSGGPGKGAEFTVRLPVPAGLAVGTAVPSLRSPWRLHS
jgi:signal transduction histidine kinase